MEAINVGLVSVIDEIEASRYPLLTRHLIEIIWDQINEISANELTK